MRRYRAVIALILGAVLAFGAAIPALAADTASGSTIRLEKTEGTVTVTTAAGTAKKVKDGGRLFSGYTVTTSGASYAYVSMDNSKTIKLDEYSQAKVQKSGKKLEVQLAYGEMFFDVNAPVEKDESYSIRTSSMMTGIHGTAGFLGVTQDGAEYISLLEGSVAVTGFGGKSGSVTISGGSSVVLDKTGENAGELQPAKYSWEDIPGFVAVEVAANETLREKIAEKTPALAEHLDEIVENAETRLAEDQAAAEELRAEQAEIQESIEKQQTEQPTEQLFAEPEIPETPADPDPSDPDPDPPAPAPVYVTVRIDLEGKQKNKHFVLSEATSNGEPVSLGEQIEDIRTDEANEQFVYNVYYSCQIEQGSDIYFKVGIDDNTIDPKWYRGEGEHGEYLVVTRFEFGDGEYDEYGNDISPTLTEDITPVNAEDHTYRITNVQPNTVISLGLGMEEPP